MISTVQKDQAPWVWTGYSFRAMNTRVQTWLYSRPAGQAGETNSAILVDVQRLFNSIEKRLSRFDPNSELSRFNTSDQEIFQASPILLDAVEIALLAAESTGGLYDPTVLGALERAGYDRSFEKISNAAPLHLAPPVAGNGVQPDEPGWTPCPFRAIQIHRAKGEIYKPHGLRLDLGGMGKGWTVDRAADRLQGLGPFMVNAGGDIFAYHSPPDQRGWEIDLIHPLKPGEFMARVYLHHQALTTSTIARRRWQHDGQIKHHLINPRTGQPAQTDALSVSVTADRAVVAEIYAKVALILGAEQGLAYLQALPGVEGLIYTAASQILYTDGLARILDRLEPAGYAHN